MDSTNVIQPPRIVETGKLDNEIVAMGCVHLFAVSSIDRVVHLEERTEACEV